MMSNHQLLVSICIPTYNGEAFISEAMRSAVSQTYANLEIIVSDDDSSDNTCSIIKSFLSKTSIPIHIHKHKPQGIGANWNHCVSKAKGDYIKFLFQDDILEPNCIEIMMNMAIKNPKVGLVYCKRKFIFDTLTSKLEAFISYYGKLHEHWDHIIIAEGILSGKVYLKDRALLNSPKNKIGEPSAALLRKSVFVKVGYFNEDLKQTLDFEFWYRIMTQFDIGFIDQILVHFRLHKDQASVLNKKHGDNEQDLLFKIYYKILFRYLDPKNQWKLLKLYHPVFKFLTAIKQKLYA